MAAATGCPSLLRQVSLSGDAVYLDADQGRDRFDTPAACRRFNDILPDPLREGKEGFMAFRHTETA